MPQPKPLRCTVPEAVPNYIISMCQSVSDMLEAMILLKEAGLFDPNDGSPRSTVRVVPLFETIEDLQQGAATILRRWMFRSIESWWSRSGHSGDHARLPDSNKDGGYMAANWALYRGELDPVEAAKKAGIRLAAVPRSRRHVGRGGGPSYDAIPRPAAGCGAGFLCGSPSRVR